jgi:hypothetical protein
MSEPFSRVVRVDSIPRGGQTVATEASPTEREALAALYRLPSIEALSAELTLMRSARGEIRVTGAVHGRLSQTCVVSLEPFPAVVNEEVDVRFAELADVSPPAGCRKSPRRSRSTTWTNPIRSSRAGSISAPWRLNSSRWGSTLSPQARRRVRSAPGSGGRRIALFGARGPRQDEAGLSSSAPF